MDEVLLLIRVLIAGIFMLAGTGKLLDTSGSAKAAADFGIPANMSVAVGYALPIAEIVLALMMLSPTTSWYGAVGASLLLFAFIGGMWWQMSQGKAPECHCFGQVHSEPVSPKSIARNVLLASLTLLLVIAGRSFQGPSIGTTPSSVLQTLLLLGIAVAAVVAISQFNKVLAGQSVISRKIELLELLAGADTPKERQEAGNPEDGLPIGALFPDFEIADRSGQITTLSGLLNAGQPLLLFFVGPTCSPCKALMPEIMDWHSALAGKAEVVLVTSGSPKENAEKLEIADGIQVIFDTDRELAQSVYARWTPSALLVRRDGRVASHIAVGDNAIRELVSKVKQANVDEKHFYIKNGNPSSKSKIGQRIPEFALEAIDGALISSKDLAERKTLAVFWSTSCPHCVAMMASLQAWDQAKSENDPKLVVFSEGDVEAHSGYGLRSPIVLEDGYKTAAELGMYGTPSAVLIDEDGVIVSEAAIGERNIWSLVRKIDLAS